ncbi:MAG: glycosyltransferase family 4 protein [Candidatus Jordarchaeaceae archaeon]
MHIGQFVSMFPSQGEEVYGAGRAAYFLCKYLSKKGHSVHVFVPSKRCFVEKEHNLSIHFYDSLFKIGVMNFSYKLLFDPLNYSLDIIHVHNDTPISVIAGLRYAIKKRKPLVVTWHGDWISNYGNIVRRMGVYLSNKFIVKKLLSKASIIVTPSIHYVQESKFLMDYAERLVEIPNGIELQEFNIPYSKNECKKILGIDESKNIVLFVGGIYPLKGPHVLLKAIPEIAKQNKNVLFIFVGGGDIRRYEILAKSLGIQEYVKFTGYIKEGQKHLYYKASDIFVLPSIETFESFGIVNLEAMSSGIPIVASKIGGIPDVVKNGENGLLVPPKDHDALADAIIYLLNNEDVREKMGRKGKERVKDYSWDKIAEKYEEVYRGLIE